MRLVAMDGMRGLFALWVVLIHAPFLSSIYNTPFVMYPAPMLTIFFVFSGFVVAMMYGESIQDGSGVARFLLKRLGRLWPLHLAMLLFLLLFVMLRLVVVQATGMEVSHAPFTEGTNIPAFFENIFFVQSWGWDKPMTWNYPAWTISTEIAAYLVLCTICLLVRAAGARIALGIVCAVIAGIVYYYQADQWTRIGELASVPRAIMEFFMGFTVFFIARRFPYKSFWIGSILEVGTLVATIGGSFLRLDGFWLLLISFAFMLMVYAFANQRGIISHLVKAKPLVWLGDISYSIYLTHVPIIFVTCAVVAVAARQVGVELWVMTETIAGPREVMDFGGMWVMNGMLVALVVTVIAVSAVTHRFIEQPCRAWVARLADKHFGKRAGAPIAAQGAQLSPSQPKVS